MTWAPAQTKPTALARGRRRSLSSDPTGSPLGPLWAGLEGPQMGRVPAYGAGFALIAGAHIIALSISY